MAVTHTELVPTNTNCCHALLLSEAHKNIKQGKCCSGSEIWQNSNCKTSSAKDDVSQRKQKFLGGLESWRSVCVKGGTFHFICQISRFYTATTRKGWAQAHSLFPTFGFSYFPHLRPASTTLSAAEQRNREQNACCTSAGTCLFPHTTNIKFIQTKASYSLKKMYYLRGF